MNAQLEMFDTAEINELRGLTAKYAALLHYEHPRNDNERLMNYQYAFLNYADGDALAKLWELADVVTLRLVKAYLKTSDDIKLEEKRDIAVEYVMRRFYDGSGWCAEKNFIYALQQGVRHACDYKTKADDINTFVDFQTFDAVRHEQVRAPLSQVRLLYCKSCSHRDRDDDYFVNDGHGECARYAIHAECIGCAKLKDGKCSENYCTE